MRYTWPSNLLAVMAVSLMGAGCDTSRQPPQADPDNIPPTIAAIADQTVLRNTLTPRSIGVSLLIDDADDDSFDVSVTSDDESVIPSTSLGCGLDPCPLVLTPSPEKSARVTLEVTVSDRRGGVATTRFLVHVVPQLVTTPSDAGPGSLRAAVAGAEAGDVIGFDATAVFAAPRTITLSSQLVLDKDLTIEGTGVGSLAISGSDAVRIFEVNTSAIVILIDLRLVHGSAERGGGIYVDAASTLTLRSSTLSSNRAQAMGGGIFNRGTLEILEGSSIDSNEANLEGGGIFNETSGEVTVSGSRVEDNRTADGLGGGGIYNRGKVQIMAGSDIENNEARCATPCGLSRGLGGGLYNEASGEIVVSDSRVSDNEALGNGGGGIFNEGRLDIVEGSSVDGNESRLWGGGGIFNDTGGEVIISDSQLVGNEAHDDIGGGGIFNRGSLAVIEGSRIADNRVTPYGGGIYNAAQTIVSDSRIEGNEAGLGAGIFNGGHVTITASTLARNEAVDGGGIYNGESGTLVVEHGSSVSANKARGTVDTRPGNGGGIYNSGHATITSSVVEGNEALIGGGIYNGNGGTLVVRESSSVAGNEALVGTDSYGRGGGIMNFGTLSLLSSSSLTNNTAVTGGGLYNAAGHSTIAASSLRGNQAGYGGGIYNGPNGEVVLNGSTVGGSAAGSGNAATEFDGGGIYNRGQIGIVRGTVAGNRAQRNGGGLFSNSGSVMIEPDQVATGAAGSTTDAEAGDGHGGSAVPLQFQLGSSVEHNVAGNRGGGIYNASNGTLVLGHFASVGANTAAAPAPSGGGIWNEGTLSSSGTVSGNAPDDVAP